MHREALGHLEQALVQLLELLGRHGRLELRVGAAADAALLAPGTRCERRLELLVHGPHALLHLVHEALDLFRGDEAVLGEPACVQLAHRAVLLDQLVHERLRVARLVALVVAEAPVADEVDDDVVAEARAERHGQADRRDGGLGVVGVHVHDRRVEALGQVARVAGRATLVGIGREAHLVVGDDVQRPARPVAREAPGG